MRQDKKKKTYSLTPRDLAVMHEAKDFEILLEGVSRIRSAFDHQRQPLQAVQDTQKQWWHAGTPCSGLGYASPSKIHSEEYPL